MSDNYITPHHVWDMVSSYIPKKKRIWEPFYHKGDSGEYLKRLGFDVIHKDIDFFNYNLGDIVVSNPPFSKKIKILNRLKRLEKPFILILPTRIINYNYFKIFKNEIQLLIPKKRINFCQWENNKLVEKKRCSFDCLFFCYKMGFDRDIIFL